MELASLGSTPAHFTAISEGGYAGAHPHFWDRAISRRGFLAGAGATVAAATVGDLLWPSAASASANGRDGPTPIPNGIVITGPKGPKLFHLFLPGPSDNLAGSLTSPGGEQVTIYNFAGDFGVAAISGTGTGTDTVTRTSKALFYDVDMRFFDGQFIDRSGESRSATFGFV